MKKQQIKNLSLKKRVVSTFNSEIKGGQDLSWIETCYSDCGYTENCATRRNCGTGGGSQNCGTIHCTGGISCPGYIC
ncbi:hypothetical protein [Ascidiimonas aurantiaca]|uniref:hypothetical protein n=1 Tax=Ascidiimonas aurantiaca TaxID=1685432 RepID=UPI0030EE7985